MKMRPSGLSGASLTTALVIALFTPSQSTATAAVENDAFAGARGVTTLPFADTADTTQASIEPGEPKPSCGIATASVWYRMTFPTDTSLRVQTTGSNHDTMLAIYRGEDLPTLTEAACNDVFIGLLGGPARILFTAQAGVTYHVQASGATFGAGRLQIAIDETARPPSLGAEAPFETRAADGTALRGHIYLPDGPGPFATVLELSPYWNTNYIASEDADVEQEDRTTVWGHLGPYFDAGFAVALVNMRGSGESDGCAQWGGTLDQTDAATIVEALAAEPWSNGSVGMVGLSFPGWTQYLAIAGAPPHLKAVVPVSGIIDLWSLLTRNGAAFQQGPIVMPLFTGAILRGAQGPVNALALGGRPFIPDNSPSHLACPRYGDDTIAGFQSYLHGDRTPYWDERDLRPAIAASDVPIFAANGLNANGEGHILQFDGLWDLMPDDRRLLLGQWAHGYPLRDDFADQAVAWLDHYLRDGPKLVETGVVEYQDSSGVWHTSDRWPPAATTVPLHLSDRSMVHQTRDVRPSEQTLGSADVDPAPFDCPDRALYVSPPVAEDVLLAGNAEVRLTVTSTQSDGNLSAFLWHTSGVALCPESPPHSADGALEWNFTFAAYEDEVTRALTDLRHPQPGAQGAPFPTGVATSVQIRSHPFATIVRAGERLVLGIGGGSYELAPDHSRPILTITTGSGAQGLISLPVVHGTLRFAPDR